MLAARARASSDSQWILSFVEQLFYSVASLEVAENQRWTIEGRDRQWYSGEHDQQDNLLSRHHHADTRGAIAMDS